MRQYASVSHSMSKNEAIIMEDFILIRPTSEYASQLAEYRQEFLDADSSMDGCGSLRRLENPEEYMRRKFYQFHNSRHLFEMLEKRLDQY